MSLLSASPESDEDSILSASDEDSILSASDDDEMEGGNGGSDSEEEDMEIDVAGEALSGAKSIFARRLKSRDPNLFLKKIHPDIILIVGLVRDNIEDNL